MSETRRRGEASFLEALAGRHRASGPVALATVSGVASTTFGMLDWFARETPVTVLTSKSIQPVVNPGNREPVITEPEPGSFGNAVGLRNPGAAATVAQLAEFAPRRERWGAGRFLVVSIAATDEASFADLAVQLAPWADAIELNLSCPHAHGGYGSTIGCDPFLVRNVTSATVRALAERLDAPPPVIAKLTPNVDDIGAIAVTAIEAGAAGISAINTVGPYQYREPTRGAVILTNPAPAGALTDGEREALRGRGGQSGLWVYDRALECVAAIRQAVGARPLIIGMGGVDSAETARAMREAGADVVGVGSALARAPQREWPAVLTTIAGDWRAPGGAGEAAAGAGATEGAGTGVVAARAPDDRATPLLRAEAGMRFREYVVASTRDLGGEMVEIELDGAIPFAAGQSVFLWIPEVGEKPYSPATARPARFVVRRRGPHTSAVAALVAGDLLWVRGPYGDGAGVVQRGPAGWTPIDPGERPAILVAGSGSALAPVLAGTFSEARCESEVWIGLRDGVTESPLAAAIRPVASLYPVWDEGVPGRVIGAFETSVTGAASGGRPTSLWAVGPEPFMEAAIEAAGRLGLPPSRVAVSLEQRMMCGVGLCGLCHHDGILTCSEGTFVAADRWVRAAAAAVSDAQRLLTATNAVDPLPAGEKTEGVS